MKNFRSFFLIALQVLLALTIAMLVTQKYAQFERAQERDTLMVRAHSLHQALSQQVLSSKNHLRYLQAELVKNPTHTAADLYRIIKDRPQSELVEAVLISYPENIISSHPPQNDEPSFTVPASHWNAALQNTTSLSAITNQSNVLLTLPVLDSPNKFVSVVFDPSVMIREARKATRVEDVSIMVYDASSGRLLRQIKPVEHDTTMEAVFSETIDFTHKEWKVVYLIPPGSLSAWSYIPGLLTFVMILFGLRLFGRWSSFRELAERRAVELLHKYNQADHKFRHVNEHLPGVVLLLDEHGHVQDINKAGRDLLGGDVQSPSLNSLLAHTRRVSHSEDMSESGSVAERVEVLDVLGLRRWLNISVSHTYVNDTKHTLVLGTDVTEMVEMAEQLQAQGKKLHFLATHDQLTGLYNRRAFEEQLDSLVARARPFSLLYMDLDQFKIVNDTAGHLAGDKLLLSIAEGLRSVAPSLFARLGGDEFGMIVEGGEKEAALVAGQVLGFFDQLAFRYDDRRYQVSASIGIAMTGQKTDHGRPMTKEDLMARSDAACYMAKQQGRNRWHVFCHDGESFAHQQEMEWTVRLQQALSEGRLVLYRQAIASLLETQQDPHFEILARLKDEEGQIISANDFIPAAERFGLMPMFDRHVLEYALSNFNNLHPHGVGVCAINVSGQTIDDPNFERFLMDLVNKYQVDPSKICIEITESAAIRNLGRMTTLLPQLRSNGFKVALDDFGVGMSSLSYLKDFEVDYIKIDGSFIRDIENNLMSSSIVTAVTDIAHKMNIEVVAEWVGSEEVANMLRAKGVDYAQGYHIAQPCPLNSA